MNVEQRQKPVTCCACSHEDRAQTAYEKPDQQHPHSLMFAGNNSWLTNHASVKIRF